MGGAEHRITAVTDPVAVRVRIATIAGHVGPDRARVAGVALAVPVLVVAAAIPRVGAERTIDPAGVAAVTDVADGVAVAIGLVGVGQQRAVVELERHAIAVAVVARVDLCLVEPEEAAAPGQVQDEQQDQPTGARAAHCGASDASTTHR